MITSEMAVISSCTRNISGNTIDNGHTISKIQSTCLFLLLFIFHAIRGLFVPFSERACVRTHCVGGGGHHKGSSKM